MANSARCAAYRLGSFVLDLDQGALLAGDGKEIPLRPKSFALLQLLVENTGRLLSREAIMEALWPDVFVTEDNITQCICPNIWDRSWLSLPKPSAETAIPAVRRTLPANSASAS